MANYIGATRTNYFRVKDEAAFREWARGWQVDIVPDDEGRFCLLPNGDESGFDPEEDHPEYDNDPDITDELPAHLAPESVCVVFHAGAEKLRYVHGYAIAVNSAGDRVDLHLYDIYAKAKHLGPEITHAEY